MTTVLWLLAILGALGAFDTLYYHEWRGRLAGRGGAIRAELALHAGRDFVYTAIFGTLPWLEWRGYWTAALCALIVTEVVVTFTDFVVEDRVRRPLGGVFPGERVMHAAMAIVYGAMLGAFVPVLRTWFDSPTAVARTSVASPVGLRVGLTLAACGIFVSGVRDLLAACAVPRSAWPWEGPRAPTQQQPSATVRPTSIRVSTAVGLVGLIILTRRRDR